MIDIKISVKTKGCISKIEMRRSTRRGRGGTEGRYDGLRSAYVSQFANVFRFAAYKQNIFKCASRAAYKFNCHIRLCPARVVVVAPAGCGVSSRVASWQILRVVVAAMVTRLLQLILKNKIIFRWMLQPATWQSGAGCDLA